MPHAKACALIAGLCLLCTLAAPALARGGAFAKLEINKYRVEAQQLISAGDYPAAEKLARSQLERAGRSVGENHRVYGNALNTLGRVLFLQGRNQEAEALLRRGLY